MATWAPKNQEENPMEKGTQKTGISLTAQGEQMPQMPNNNQRPCTPSPPLLGITRKDNDRPELGNGNSLNPSSNPQIGPAEATKMLSHKEP